MTKATIELASELEYEACYLGEAVGTYDFILEELELESGREFKETTAAPEGLKEIIFARRFKAILPALQMVCRDLRERTERVNAIVNELYKVSTES